MDCSSRRRPVSGHAFRNAASASSRGPAEAAPFEAARQQLFGKRKAVSLQAIKLVSQKNENRTGWAQVQVLRASVSPWLSKQEKGTAITRALFFVVNRIG